MVSLPSTSGEFKRDWRSNQSPMANTLFNHASLQRELHKNPKGQRGFGEFPAVEHMEVLGDWCTRGTWKLHTLSPYLSFVSLHLAVDLHSLTSHVINW